MPPKRNRSPSDSSDDSSSDGSGSGSGGSGSSSKESSSGSDEENGFTETQKLKKNTKAFQQQHQQPKQQKSKIPANNNSSSSSSSSDDDDGEWNAKPTKTKTKRKTKGNTKAASNKSNKSSGSKQQQSKKKLKLSAASTFTDSDDDMDANKKILRDNILSTITHTTNTNYNNNNNTNNNTNNLFRKKFSLEEKEEGEVDFSDDDFLGEFNDGLDDELYAGEEDKKKLHQMTEKEREQELFNRSEKRQVLKTRFEIEKKLRLAKKQINSNKQQQNNANNNDHPSHHPHLHPHQHLNQITSESNNNKSIINDNNKPSTSSSMMMDQQDQYNIESTSRSIERRRNMEDKRKVKDAMKGLKAEREKKKEKLKQKLKATDIYSDSSDSDGSGGDGGRGRGDRSGRSSGPDDQKVSSKKSQMKKSSTSDEDDDYSSDSSGSYDSDQELPGIIGNKGKGRKGQLSGSGHHHQIRSSQMNNNQFNNQQHEQFDFTINHLNSIRLSRYKLQNWCHSPFFKDTVLNAFVRIGAGIEYMVGQIIDVVETAKIYELGNTRTNKGIKLRMGNNFERVYRLEFVSNKEITEHEFEQWRTKMIDNRSDFPTKALVEKKKEDIHKAINYNYSEQDVELIVAEKERFKDKPTNFAMKKTQLLKDKEYAEMKGDHQTALQLSKEIDRLEEESKKLDKKRTQSIASISFINERNRMKNIKEAERALAESAREAQNNKDDPFTRRKCTPTMIHVFNKNKQQQSNDTQQQQSADPNQSNNNSTTTTIDSDAINNNNSSSKNGNNQNVNNNSNALPSSSTSSSSSAAASTSNNNRSSPSTTSCQDVNDMFFVHDFDIKIDFNSLNNNSVVVGPATTTISSSSSSNNLDTSGSGSGLISGISNGVGGTAGGSGPRTNSLSSVTTNRRSLNLDEYKKKKGLI